MKLLGVEQLREADSITLSNQKITFLELMERAGESVFKIIHERLNGAKVPIHIFCGLGNNGGDGLVVARYLLEHGYHITTYIVNFSTERSQAFLENYNQLKEISKNWPIQIKSADDFPDISSNDLIIDAIFGIGLSRPMHDWVKKLVEHINQSKAFTLSIDIPSGLYLEKAQGEETAVVYANSCLTFQTPKLIFFLPETAQYVQDFEVLDIGLDATFLQNVEVNNKLIGKQQILNFYKPRTKFSHKGTYGHALIIGGSKGKIGSVHLAAKACLRAGVGLATALVPSCGHKILQTSLPELMLAHTTHKKRLGSLEASIQPTVVCMGMGMGTHKDTAAGLKNFLKSNQQPLVLDADALNIISKDHELLQFLPKETVLTPHPKELERLIGSWENDFDKIEKTKALSKKIGCVILIKGAHTLVIHNELLFVNTTGNPGMATAGSGDVLAGIIAGFIAQGYGSLHAAIFGVYVHGSAGDIAVGNLGYQSLLASDIIEHLGMAFLELFKKPQPLASPN